MTFGINTLETVLYHKVEIYCDTLNRVGLDHECDRQTDTQNGIKAVLDTC